MIEYVDKIEAMNLSLGRKTDTRLSEHFAVDSVDDMYIETAERLNKESNGHGFDEGTGYWFDEHLEDLKRNS